MAKPHGVTRLVGQHPGIVDAGGEGEGVDGHRTAPAAVGKRIAEDADTSRTHVILPGGREVRPLPRPIGLLDRWHGRVAAPVAVQGRILWQRRLHPGVQMHVDARQTIGVDQRGGVVGHPQVAYRSDLIPIVGSEPSRDNWRELLGHLPRAAQHEVNLDEEVLVARVGAPQGERHVLVNPNSRRGLVDVAPAQDFPSIRNAIAVGVPCIGSQAALEAPGEAAQDRAGPQFRLQLRAETVVVGIVPGEGDVIAHQARRPRCEVLGHGDDDLARARRSARRVLRAAGDTSAPLTALEAQAVALQDVEGMCLACTIGQADRLHLLLRPQVVEPQVPAGEGDLLTPRRTIHQQVAGAGAVLRASPHDQPVLSRFAGAVDQSSGRAAGPVVVDGDFGSGVGVQQVEHRIAAGREIRRLKADRGAGGQFYPVLADNGNIAVIDHLNRTGRRCGRWRGRKYRPRRRERWLSAVWTWRRRSRSGWFLQAQQQSCCQ